MPDESRRAACRTVTHVDEFGCVYAHQPQSVWPPRGADIEVYERIDKATDVPSPQCIRINGVDLLTTDASSIEMRPMRFGKDVVVVDIKGIICRSLSFSQEVEDDA